MKVVKQISTGRIVYRQNPDFEPGKGILNAKTMGFPEADLEEVDVSQVDWDAEVAKRGDEKKETELNAPVINALIEALEDKFPMIRGQLRKVIKDKMP